MRYTSYIFLFFVLFASCECIDNKIKEYQKEFVKGLIEGKNHDELDKAIFEDVSRFIYRNKKKTIYEIDSTFFWAKYVDSSQYIGTTKDYVLIDSTDKSSVDSFYYVGNSEKSIFIVKEKDRFKIKFKIFKKDGKMKTLTYMGTKLNKNE